MDELLASIDWKAIGTVVVSILGGTGLVALIAKAADKLFPDANSRLADAAARRKERAERLIEVEESEEEYKQKWLDAEKRLLEAERRLLKQDVTSDLVRRNVERPHVALVPVHPQLYPAPTPEDVDGEDELHRS